MVLLPELCSSRSFDRLLAFFYQKDEENVTMFLVPKKSSMDSITFPPQILIEGSQMHVGDNLKSPVEPVFLSVTASGVEGLRLFPSVSKQPAETFPSLSVVSSPR